MPCRPFISYSTHNPICTLYICVSKLLLAWILGHPVPIYIHSKLVEPRGQHYHKALTCQRYWLYESGVVDEMEETGPHVKEKDFSRRRGGGVAVEEGRGRKTHPSAVFRADPRHPISRHKCRGRGVFREMEWICHLLSPPLQYRLFRGMRPLPFEDRSLHAVYSYLKDRVFDDEETTEPTKRKERGGGPNFIPNPRNLLSSPLQVAKRNPFP